MSEKRAMRCYLCGTDHETLDRLMTHLKRGCPGLKKVPVYRGRNDDEPYRDEESGS